PFAAARRAAWPRLTQRTWVSPLLRLHADVPAQHATLDQLEKDIRDDSDEAEQDDPAPHLLDLEQSLELDDVEPDAVGRGEHLADDHHDDGNRQRLAAAHEDLRTSGRDRHREQATDAADPVGLRGVDLREVRAANAFDGVEEDRPEAAECDDRDLHTGAEAREEHHDRNEHGRRNRTEQLEHRFGEQPDPAEGSDQDAHADTDDEGADVADRETRDAREDI